MPTIHLHIKGKVQGVFYRATAKEVAKEIGIRGWIRNTPDKDVEALILGTQQQLDSFINWCKQGPRRAVVTEVIISPNPDLDFDEFEIEH